MSDRTIYHKGRRNYGTGFDMMKHIDAIEVALAAADDLAEACDQMADAVNSTSADVALAAYREARK
jgi:hypothetical protein